MYDVIVIGGGPAGLSCALVLARACRKVLIIDKGKGRNSVAQNMHNYLSQDGISPKDFLERSSSEVLSYGVDIIRDTVDSAKCTKSDGPKSTFSVQTRRNLDFSARRLVIATGVKDVLPEIQNFKEYYGRGIHHCPYCDAYEYRQKTMIALGEGNSAVGLALSLKTWTSNVIACTEGVTPDQEKLAAAERNAIKVVRSKATSIIGNSEKFTGLALTDGQEIKADALFFNTDQTLQSTLPAILGCDYETEKKVATERRQRTTVPGVYLAGDADDGVQFVIAAAAEGATAAVAANHSLQEEDRA